MDSITQTEVFEKTTTQNLYDLLLDEAQHSEFTGSVVHINPIAGGIFSAYNNYCSGTNIELVAGKKIVQSWRALDWPEGIESTVTFEFEQDGNNVIIYFTQTGVPAEHVEAIAQGWIDFYWEPIREYIKQ